MFDSFPVWGDWCVDVVVGQVEEERNVFLSRFNEPNGFLSKPLSHVFIVLVRCQICIAPGGLVAARRRASVAAADVKVEALVRWPVTFAAQVPLPSEECLEAGISQHFSDRDFFQSQIVAIVDVQKPRVLALSGTSAG